MKLRAVLLALAATAFPPSAARSETGPATIAVVGDLVCGPDTIPRSPADCQHAQVAALIDREQPAALLTPGDLQYEIGTLDAFRSHYDTHYGSWRNRTFPAVGNHEYKVPGALGYADYFSIEQGRYWYAADLPNGWRLITLDSNCGEVGCGMFSEQVRWLDRELTENPRLCTIVQVHHPRWSSGYRRDTASLDLIWRKVVAARVDVFVAGHDHWYERQSDLDEAGVYRRGGTDHFIVGTGGLGFTADQAIRARDASTNALITDRYGALFLTLHADRYDFAFKDTAGRVLDQHAGNRCY